MSSHLLVPSRPRTFRRVSSENATSAQLAKGREPTTVVPPSLMERKSNAHEVAMAMELARLEIDDDESPSSETPPESSVTDKYAFAFDIDGVLIRGGAVIPEAIEAMKVLNGDNPYGLKVPYIFLTNGGGKTEQERCIQLSKQLDLEISVGQFISGHTPMREMVEKYHTVLVVGGEGEKCREIAEGYGFKDVVTPGDIMKDNPDTTPFRKLTKEEHANSKDRSFKDVKFEAIFVFADSRHWGDDQQIILDLLLSKDGVLGTRSETFDEGPQIYFAHNDIVWSAAHDLTRLGMGALRVSIEAMYKAVTGKELNAISFGKPSRGTYQFANRLLTRWRRDTHGINAPPDTVYFVGDTPESDIRGTNEFNETVEQEWYSLLVRTGVYQEGTKPRFTPKHTSDNVLDAVRFAMEREHKRSLREVLNIGDKFKTTTIHESALLSPEIKLDGNPMEILA